MTDEQKTQPESDLKLPSAQELLEAGVHFGHRTSRWHPKMAPYIFGIRNNVHIFDLEKTLKKLAEALIFMKGVIERGGKIIFVGTKPAAKGVVREAAQALSQPYVIERWLGGTLTNFKTITKRLEYLRELEEQQNSGVWQDYTKKERLQQQKKLAKLLKQLAGIKDLTVLPLALLVTDTKIDSLAIREAKRRQIPVVAICDTNSDPLAVDYVIPANDDATSSLKILLETITQNLRGVKVGLTAGSAEKLIMAEENEAGLESVKNSKEDK